MQQLTARPSSPGTHEEAWKAWEAARLALMGKEWVARQRPHLKNFNKAMNSARRWWLFAFETLPNSGIVVLHRLDGTKERINILRPLVDMPNMAGRYAVSPEYPLQAEKQKELLESGKTEIRLWELFDEPRRDKAPATFRVLYHNDGEELPVEYRKHYCDDFRQTVNLQKSTEAVVVSLVDPDSTSCTVLWCPLPGTTLYGLYEPRNPRNHYGVAVYGVRGLKAEHIHAHACGN